LLERSGELQPLLGRRIEQRDLAECRGRDGPCPISPRSRCRSAGVSGDGPYTASTTCNLASIKNWSSTSTTTSEDAPRPSVSHAHTGQFAYACATAGEAARFRSSEFAAAAAPASTGLAADRRDLRARPEQPRAGFGLHGAIAIDGLGGYGRGRARVRAYMPIYCVSRASSKSHRAKYSARPGPRRN